jgi:hypothetical protein
MKIPRNPIKVETFGWSFIGIYPETLFLKKVPKKATFFSKRGVRFDFQEVFTLTPFFKK